MSRTIALPVLDISGFDAKPAEHAAFLSALRDAAHGIGFFHLVGHGISTELVRDAFALARRFFSLPDAEKCAVEMIHSPHFRGYTRVGAERTRGGPDWREQIDIGAERAVIADGPPWSRLQGPNQWPSTLPELRTVALRWQAEATALLIRLLRAFALALGQREDVFELLCRGAPHQLLKIIRYPGREAGRGDQGVGAHKDGGILTALMQDDRGGLQVETASGWIDVAPLEGAFVINIGEALEMATDGYLRGTVHRVIAPPPGTDRLSIAFFLGARLDATVPLLRLPPPLAAQSRGIARDPSNPLFCQVGENYLKGRLRSHPDVAQRYHADLLDAFAMKPTGEPSAY